MHNLLYIVKGVLMWNNILAKAIFFFTLTFLKPMIYSSHWNISIARLRTSFSMYAEGKNCEASSNNHC
jgi:hypothetical protein